MSLPNHDPNTSLSSGTADVTRRPAIRRRPPPPGYTTEEQQPPEYASGVEPSAPPGQPTRQDAEAQQQPSGPQQQASGSSTRRGEKQRLPRPENLDSIQGSGTSTRRPLQSQQVEPAASPSFFSHKGDLATHLTGQVVNSTRRSRSDSRGDRIRMHQPHDRSQADDFDVEEGSDAGTDEMDEKHLTI